MAYEIVVSGHNGVLSVESEEGEGAVFTITIPKPAYKSTGATLEADIVF